MKVSAVTPDRAQKSPSRGGAGENEWMIKSLKNWCLRKSRMLSKKLFMVILILMSSHHLEKSAPHEREKYIKAPHEEGHNREEMNKVEELKMLKDLLVKWEMKEGDAKNAALGLIYGGGFIQFFPVGRDNC